VDGPGAGAVELILAGVGDPGVVDGPELPVGVELVPLEGKAEVELLAGAVGLGPVTAFVGAKLIEAGVLGVKIGWNGTCFPFFFFITMK
jgi:hypothetical protein